LFDSNFSVVKLMLDGVIGRVLELKQALVNLECSDYQFFDDILADLKLLPEDIEISIPNCFRRDNLSAVRERDKILEALGAQTTGLFITFEFN
jgi:hypothetical protein